MAQASLAQYLTAWFGYFGQQFAAINQRIDGMSTLGMTDVEAQAFAALSAEVAAVKEQVAGLLNSMQAVIAAQAGNAERITALVASMDAHDQAASQRMSAIEASVEALQAWSADLPMPGETTAGETVTVPEIK